MSMTTLIMDIKRLYSDLAGINVEKVERLIEDKGLYETARILGYDSTHYDNMILAGRLAIEDVRRKCPQTLLDYAERAKELLNEDVYNFIVANHQELQKAIDNSDAGEHDWFSANTLITMYLLRPTKAEEPIEIPQYLWMRVAVQFFFDVSVERVIVCYQELVKGLYTPASPMLFNAGCKRNQMSSCFLLTVDDNMKSLYRHGHERIALISKYGGGLGVNLSNVRHSEISRGGLSKGVVSYGYTLDSTIHLSNQGGGDRKGAQTLFLKIHHIDAYNFVSATKKNGEQYDRFRNSNTCLWTCNLFWKRVEEGGSWSMFCPNKTPLLNNVWGKELEAAYLMYEQDSSFDGTLYKKTMPAMDLLKHIISVQRESGMPYLMNGDACNMKSNQKHLGCINSSNLCLEIIEYHDSSTIASCNLHNIVLSTMATGKKISKNSTIDDLCDAVDFDLLGKTIGNVCDNINSVIDKNWYPLQKKDGSGPISNGNKKYRPLAIGVCGFAELLYELDLPMECPETELLNKMIFASMYYNALVRSVQSAIDTAPFDTFEKSPTAQGKLQFDLWRDEFLTLGGNSSRSFKDDDEVDPSVWRQKEVTLYKDGKAIDTIKATWTDLKRCIMLYGLRNSLLIALMPTASTAQIRRASESVEVPQTNLYSRRVIKGNYSVLNRYLVKDLEEIGLWSEHTFNYLLNTSGDLAGFTNYALSNPSLYKSVDTERSRFLESKYKTVWNVSQKWMLKLAADRSRYIDQACSTNIYMKDVTDKKLIACHRYSHQLGLKTMMYYLRQTGGEIAKFTAESLVCNGELGSPIISAESSNNEEGPICYKEEGCTWCS